MLDIKEKSENLSIFAFSDPGGVRTHDPQLRRLLLYPTELRNQTSQDLIAGQAGAKVI